MKMMSNEKDELLTITNCLSGDKNPAHTIFLANFSPGRKNPSFENPGRKFPGRVALRSSPRIKHFFSFFS